MEQIGFKLYLLFMASWLLHLTNRLSWLGSVRFDLLLVLLLFLIHFFFQDSKGLPIAAPYKKLRNFILIIVAITPLAQYPGSVLHYGLGNFIKGVVFFYFTVWFVKSEKQLRTLLATFILCQTFRIFEPVYLHMSQGYWGSKASMAGEFMNRLAGSPYDVINPNGLAYVILTVIPFLIMFFELNIFYKVLSIIVVPVSLYAMTLTGSRSGFAALILLSIAMMWLSKRKIYYLFLLGIASILVVHTMTDNLKDRYRSVYDSNSRNSATVAGRLTGLERNFTVGMRRPFFGHGLGTSLEANANFGATAQPAHNLLLEVFQELGVVGVAGFAIYILYVFKELFQGHSPSGTSLQLEKTRKSLMALAIASLFFGLASYGLSSYEWYLIGGCAVCINMLTKRDIEVCEGSYGR